MPTAKSPIVRLKPSTYRYLQKRSRTEGKPIGRLIDEAVRPRKQPDPWRILEAIQDLLDDHFVLQAMGREAGQTPVPLDQVIQEHAAKPRKTRPRNP